MVGKSDPHKIKNKNHILVQSIRVTPKSFEPCLKWQTMTVTQPCRCSVCEVQHTAAEVTRCRCGSEAAGISMDLHHANAAGIPRVF